MHCTNPRCITEAEWAASTEGLQAELDGAAVVRLARPPRCLLLPHPQPLAFSAAVDAPRIWGPDFESAYRTRWFTHRAERPAAQDEWALDRMPIEYGTELVRPSRSTQSIQLARFVRSCPDIAYRY